MLLKNSLNALLPYDVRRPLYACCKRKHYSHLQKARTCEDPESISFKPFMDREAVFIHIPKAAGVSVGRSLFGRRTGGHTRLKDYQLAFSKSELERYFKFTFVRNPWDRLYSAYTFLKKGGMCEEDQRWSAQHLSTYSSFEDFVLRWVQRGNVQSYIHFIPQYQFLISYTDQDYPVDYVGFFENIEHDFDVIRTRVNMDASLAHKNKTERSQQDGYDQHYTPEMINVVRKVYAEDIALFGYCFDNSSLPEQIRMRDDKRLLRL